VPKIGACPEKSALCRQDANFGTPHPIFAPHERQGGGADQNAPARVGLPLRPSHKPAPQPSSAQLPQVVQPPATAPLARRPAADQPRLKRLWSVNLGRRGQKPAAPGLQPLSRPPSACARRERWVGSARRECLERLLIFSRPQLVHVLRVYTRHYNQHRPHRALALRPPEQANRSATTLSAPAYPQLTRRDLLGGLIHEYDHAA
jgi:hypothetical protein